LAIEYEATDSRQYVCAAARWKTGFLAGVVGHRFARSCTRVGSVRNPRPFLSRDGGVLRVHVVCDGRDEPGRAVEREFVEESSAFFRCVRRSFCHGCESAPMWWRSWTFISKCRTKWLHTCATKDAPSRNALRSAYGLDVDGWQVEQIGRVSPRVFAPTAVFRGRISYRHGTHVRRGGSGCGQCQGAPSVQRGPMCCVALKANYSINGLVLTPRPLVPRRRSDDVVCRTRIDGSESNRFDAQREGIRVATRTLCQLLAPRRGLCCLHNRDKDAQVRAIRWTDRVARLWRTV
jgi:hypothetical protein